MLLAIAVILPTVCLLWFMTQAVKNERLAIRQKLVDSYLARAEDIFYKFPETFWSQEKNHGIICSHVLYDANENITYPVVPENFPDLFKTNELPDSIHKIWKLEFTDNNYPQAIKEYETLSNASSQGDIKHECHLGIVRCLTKQNKLPEAVKICHELAYPDEYIEGKYTPQLICQDRLMLASLYSRTNDKDLLKELQKQIPETIKLFIISEKKIFILNQLIDIAKANDLTESLKTEIKNAKKIIDKSLVSLEVVDYFEQNPDQKSHALNSFYKIRVSEPLYGFYLKINNGKMLNLVKKYDMIPFWQKSIVDFSDELVFCRIFDNDGQLIAGDASEGELFKTLNLKNHFQGWKAELYLRSGIFNQAADKKRFIYIWVASIVIVLMFASTLLASSAVLKQAKLNRLKNDFIATVTHELKTPLASTRLLVDTLLEGKCADKQQETEYLQLISKENARLGRLIDNFLTFSRMERNKQVFAMTPTSPVEIANAATEAIQTKFEKENVHFTMDIAKPLPMINADKDAMTTVLVNLLDNAYKYSNENKEIELRVFVDDSNVCFAVKDNGIGLTRRQMKKVFDKFYQADNSLSRKVEGTGLGLSIVKFIVDAHKGKIEVESKIGKGSEFKIKLNS